MEYFYNLEKAKKVFLDNEKKVSSKIIHSKNIMCSFLDIEPNTVIPSHQHNEEQILIILEGSILHTVNGKTKLLQQGDIAVQPANVSHGGITGERGLKGIDIFSPIREDFLELNK